MLSCADMWSADTDVHTDTCNWGRSGPGTWKMKLKMAVFGPSAANATLLVCPTHAVSTYAQAGGGNPASATVFSFAAMYPLDRP